MNTLYVVKLERQHGTKSVVKALIFRKGPKKIYFGFYFAILLS